MKKISFGAAYEPKVNFKVHCVCPAMLLGCWPTSYANSYTIYFYDEINNYKTPVFGAEYEAKTESKNVLTS